MPRLTRLRRLLRHPLVPSFYIPAFFFALAEGLLIPILPLYAKSLAGSYGLVGLLLAGDGLGTLLGNLPAGLALRYLDKRRAMLVGLGAMALSTLALVWVEVVWVALLLRWTTGLSRALFSVARHTHVADAVTVTSRGRGPDLPPPGTGDPQATARLGFNPCPQGQGDLPPAPPPLPRLQSLPARTGPRRR
ncbi:MAG: MFS transporter [Anaerolineales bacterium]